MSYFTTRYFMKHVLGMSNDEINTEMGCIGGISLAVLLVVGIVAGTVSLTKNNKHDGNTMAIVSEAENNSDTKVFAPHEHTVSIPFNQDPSEDNIQYDYYEGYEPTSILIDFDDEWKFNKGVIAYRNSVEVKHNPVGTDKDGQSLFIVFGEPLVKKDDYDTSDDDIKIFAPGHHIISTPLKEKSENNDSGYSLIYSCPAGYDNNGVPITIGLFVNDEQVKCKTTGDKDGKAQYTDFGTSIVKKLMK